MDFREWQETIKCREHIVADNIVKGQKNEFDSGVEINHRGISELTEYELVGLMTKFYIGTESTADMSEKMKYKQALDMVLTEIKKRR